MFLSARNLHSKAKSHGSIPSAEFALRRTPRTFGYEVIKSPKPKGPGQIFGTLFCQIKVKTSKGLH